MRLKDELADNWMLTYTGKAAHPWEPKVEEIDIEDIAHALSLICRFGGHCRYHYSVAQHSVLVSHIVPAQYALEGLLHDATEAYCGDLVRDIKCGLPEYKELEENLRRVIAVKFGIPPEVPRPVKDADNIALATERRDLLPDWGAGKIRWAVEHAGYMPHPDRIASLRPEQAEYLFLERFRQLTY